VPHLVALLHRVWPVAWCHPVLSPCHVAHDQRHYAIRTGRLTTLVMSYEWSTGLTLHCSRMSAHLAGLNCLSMVALKTGERTLKTREPWCVGQLSLSLFLRLAELRESRGTWWRRSPPQQKDGIRSYGACGSIEVLPIKEAGSSSMEHVASLKPTLTGRWGPVLRDA
jgi:hypothetical protein